MVMRSTASDAYRFALPDRPSRAVHVLARVPAGAEASALLERMRADFAERLRAGAAPDAMKKGCVFRWDTGNYAVSELVFRGESVIFVHDQDDRAGTIDALERGIVKGVVLPDGPGFEVVAYDDPRADAECARRDAAVFAPAIAR